MGFNYDRDTKNHYQDDRVAREYHAQFANAKGWKAKRHKLIADRERRVVAEFLARVTHGSVLDAPTGTGKLAPVFAKLGASVVACDISANMLELARTEFSKHGLEARFRICDLERATATLENDFDVAVCLRLLHRVPPAGPQDDPGRVGQSGQTRDCFRRG